MEECSVHSEKYSLFCVNCERLLCFKCLDEHGRFGHVIKSSEGTAQIFREKLLEFQKQLKAKQESITRNIGNLAEMSDDLGEMGVLFQDFSTDILAVFQNVEEILDEIKTSILSKYS